MQQARRKAILTAVFSPLLMASHCPASASVDLTHVERYQSNFGVFDAPQFGLGDILDIDTAALKGARIYTVLPQQGDSTIGPLIDSAAIASSIDMDVRLDTKVKARDVAAVEAAVKAYAASHTAFELKGFRRINLTDPVARLNLTPSKVADLRARLATPGARLYLIVGAVIVANIANLRVIDSTGAAASATLIHAGNYDVNVSYNRNAELTQAARQGPVFYKVLQLALGPNHDLIATAAVVDLSKYSFANGLIMANH